MSSVEQRGGALKAIVQSAKESKDLLVDLAKMTGNAITDSNVLDRVPIVNAAIAIVGVADTVLAYKLRRNVAAFLEACETAAPEKLDQMYTKVMGDPRHRDDVPDTIMQLLMDSHKPLKAKLVGNLFVALSDQRLTTDDFHMLTLLILNASIPALNALDSFFEGNDGRPYVSRPAILEQEPLLLSLGVAARQGNMFRVDKYGEQLFEFGYRKPISRNAEHQVYTEALLSCQRRDRCRAPHDGPLLHEEVAIGVVGVVMAGFLVRLSVFTPYLLLERLGGHRARVGVDPEAPFTGRVQDHGVVRIHAILDGRIG